jgi:hypothetical protein
VLLKKICFILLVDLTNTFALYERTFMLVVFFIVIELALDANVNPFALHYRGVRQIKTLWTVLSILYLLALAISADEEISVILQILTIFASIFSNCAHQERNS